MNTYVRDNICMGLGILTGIALTGILGLPSAIAAFPAFAVIALIRYRASSIKSPS